MKGMMGLVLAATVWSSIASADPNTDRIVYIREGKDARGRNNMVLEYIQADGGGRAVIFDSDNRDNPDPVPFPKWQRSPDVSPVGGKIVLRRGWTISAMNWDGSELVQLTPYRREWQEPRWSPDGRRIALTTDIRNLAEIFVMDHDGGNLRNLTWKTLSNERSPDWSPDGERIVFISDRNGKFELFTMNARDGMGQTRILSLDGDIREPIWGAGNRIAFGLQKADGTSSLFVVDPDGGNLEQVTDGDVWDGQPAWDADGKRLAFVSNRAGTTDIWVLDMASGEMRNVTGGGGGTALFPAWVPRQLSAEPLAVPAENGVAINTKGLELPRPRMLFRAEDLPGIRERLAAEPHAPVWQTFIARCERLLGAESKDSKQVEASIHAIRKNPSKGLYDRSPWIEPVFHLAFAYQVTGDERYGQRGADWLVRIAAEYAQWHQRMVAEYPVACAYDWLHDLFAPDDLQRVTGVLQTGAADSYRQIGERYFGASNDITGNFATHSAGSFGPIALALAGEPGSDASWLPAAARLISINLDTWIGDNGDCSEGTSYFNTPIRLVMPFLVSLKMNDLHPETRNNNLQHFANWLAIVNAGGYLPAIGDSDGGPLNFPLGLLRLYPDNATAWKLWNSIERAERPDADVLSLLWFAPSDNQPQDFTDLPKAAYFDAQNYQVFRTGYDDDSALLTFTLTAGGHAHLECGAIALRAFGEQLLVDPGQAVGEADRHSQLLIDGQGRFDNYRQANTPKDRIAPIQADGLAAASSVGMVPAFATRVVGTHATAPYAIPAPGIKLERGRRAVLMVGDDTAGVPPYYLVYDDVRVGNQETLYEQLYIGAADAMASDNGNGSFTYRKEYDGAWLAPTGGAKGEAAFEFDIPESGHYQIWVYAQPSGGGVFPFRVGETNYRARLAIRRGGWRQWAQAVFGEGGSTDLQAVRQRMSGEPVLSAILLEAGAHILVVGAGDARFAKIALVPVDPERGTSFGDERLEGVISSASSDRFRIDSTVFNGWGELPAGTLIRSHEQAVVTGDGWGIEKPERPAPELLVAALCADPVEFTAEIFSFNTRFYGQQFIAHPRAKLIKRQVEANFPTLVYPYLPGMEMPTVVRGDGRAEIRWPNAVDTVRFDRDGINVRRQAQAGKSGRFEYRFPAN